MRRTIHPSLFTLLGLIVAMSVWRSASAASESAFTYQGRLSAAGDSANGQYDFEFRLFAAETNGTALAGPVSASGVMVTNGLFQAAIDFGPAVFNGEARWLEIAVQCSLCDGLPVTLSPRQALTAAPYALHAANASGLMSFANAPLDIKINGERVMRYEPAVSPTLGFMPNLIGGGGGSFVTTPNYGVTISGGGSHQVEDQSYFSTISGGLSNWLASGTVFSVIAGGEANQIGQGADHATISGGTINRIGQRAYGSTIAGGISNVIELQANGALIGGGENNRMDVECDYAVIAGGTGNSFGGFNWGSVIGGGISNRAGSDARYSTIAGGVGNIAGGRDSMGASVGGGLQNTIYTFTHADTVGGGQSNRIDPYTQHATIGGGSDNIIMFGDGLSRETYVAGGTIGGGLGNIVGEKSRAAVVSGGESNQANGPYSTVAGGQLNMAAGTNSFASGYGCLASGNYSTAMGYNTLASGEYSTAMGPNATATAHDAIAMGAGTTANGVYSRAMGVASTAAGWASTAMGANTYASGDSSTAMGRDTMAAGFASTAMGRESEASGSFSFAMGWHAAASGPFTIAMGWDTTASGLNSTAMGYGTTASGDYSTAMGHRAQSTNDGTFVWADSEDADFASTGTNQFLIRASGGVGINTDSPQFALHVNGEAGKPGGGAWSVASDARLKKDIRPLEQALARLLQLHGVTYEYKDPKAIHELPGQQTGLIAQEVEKVFPNWVETAPDGMRRVSIRGFEALAVEALRDLRTEKDAQISALEKRLAALEAKLSGGSPQ